MERKVHLMKNTKFKLNQIFVLIILLAFGQGFGAKCTQGSVWGDFNTEPVEMVDDYYPIDSPNKLAWVACVTTHESSTYGNKTFKLTDDIDLGGKLFIPISESPKGGTKFAGTINGQGHTIRGLYIKGSEIIKPEKGGASGYAQNVGLVSVLGTGGVIENLILEVSDIYASSSAGGVGSQGTAENPVSVGTLVGWMSDGTIRNCVVEGSITSSGNKNRVGGLVGNAWNATITDCVSRVSISASGTDSYVGGIVGALRSEKNKADSKVTLSSCVYEGDTLVYNGGTPGGIIGYHERSSVTATNLYYTGEYNGTGKPKEGVTIPTTPKDEDKLNSEEVVCALNKGSWNAETDSCSGATSDVWSEGQSDVSLNGSDGYKVSFNANGGSFSSGAKTFKIVAKNALITADEITIPILANKKFAGWATTDDAEKPTELGEANSNKTLYAVWYDYYTVTFEIDSKTHETRSVVVPKHGRVSVEGFSVPSVFYDKISDTVSVKYYFTGWAFSEKKLAADKDPTPSDTLHLPDIDVVQDTALYPVWTRAETYSVTFNATLHGKTYVHFVKKVSEGDTVARPNDVVTNPGYSIEEWCTDADCTEGSKYEFSSKLESNLTLYAKWKLEKYAITYVMNGGKNNVANPDSFTVESDPIIFAKPTYDGNTFGGWFYDAGFTSPATGIATGSTTGNKTLYAKWTPIVYTIEYLSGDEVSATIVADKKPWGANWTLKGMEYAFQREGYVHNGWSLTENGPIAYAFGATYSEDKDLILYPHWTEKTCPSYLLYDFGAIQVYENCDGTKTAEIDGMSTGEVSSISPEDNILVNAITFNREFPVNAADSDKMYSTIVLPFSIDKSKVPDAEFYELNSIDVANAKIEFWTTKDVLQANTPYIIRTTASKLSFNLEENETIAINTSELNNSSSDDGLWEFRGTYSYIRWDDREADLGKAYGFRTKAQSSYSIGSFARIGTGATTRPFRAYLLKVARQAQGHPNMLGKPYPTLNSITPDAETGSFDVVIVDRETEETTVIGKLNPATGEIKVIDSWFDMQGRKLNAKPTTKGIYYYNGKRVMVK